MRDKMSKEYLLKHFNTKLTLKTIGKFKRPVFYNELLISDKDVFFDSQTQQQLLLKLNKEYKAKKVDVINPYVKDLEIRIEDVD